MKLREAAARWWRRAWTDTLFKRLFLLMWVALVASTLFGFLSIHRDGPPDAGAPSRGGGRPLPPGLPMVPSLPPLGGLGGPGSGPPPDGAGRDRGGPLGGPGAPGRPQGDGGDGPGAGPRPSSPDAGLAQPPLLWLDYAVRIAVIALAAWFGTRWLSTPMRRLAAASQSLAVSLGSGRLPAPLDEQYGTSEVRQTARVFNDMARRLHAQFDQRGLVMAALSHDLRTPMTRLRMRLEQRAAGDAAAERCVADLREMDDMIDGVLDALRDERAPEAKRPLDVHALVQALADDLAEQGHHVAVQGESLVIAAAPAALRRVLSNLLGNALRYGTQAAVSVSRGSGGAARIVVDDDGPGIPPDRIEAMFQPFVRLDASRSRSGGGVGLGLYIARDLVERQGGSLTLANRPEGGLRAEVTLPAG